jgi:hypothetical protein
MKGDSKTTQNRALAILIAVCIALPLIIEVLYSANDEINDFLRKVHCLV